jgi:hypothetical protein
VLGRVGIVVVEGNVIGVIVLSRAFPSTLVTGTAGRRRTWSRALRGVYAAPHFPAAEDSHWDYGKCVTPRTNSCCRQI